MWHKGSEDTFGIGHFAQEYFGLATEHYERNREAQRNQSCNSYLALDIF